MNIQIPDLTDQQCSDILDTAMCGSAYWARGRNFKRTFDGDLCSCDLADKEEATPQWNHVDYAAIRLGVERLLSGSVQYGNVGRLLEDLIHDELFVRTDAGDADCIVQAGIFNSLVYG